MSEMKPYSIRLPEELIDELRRRDDINGSGACRQFLQEYLAGGQSTEAALVLRRERLEEELSDVDKRKKQLEREIEELSKRLESKKNKRRNLYQELEDAELPEHTELTPDNPLVADLAKDTDLTPEELYVEYVEWSG